MNVGAAADLGNRKSDNFRALLDLRDDGLLIHDADDISIIATMQEQSCKRRWISIPASLRLMEGLEADTAFVRELCQWVGKAPSVVAREAKLAATTLLRSYSSTATTRISQPTFEKLRARYPEFPGWRREYPDQIGMLGERADPNEQRDELVYIREVDISLAMGDPATAPVEEHPATQLVPFNLGFVRSLTRTDTKNLVIMSGQGDSMEPTLLRSDVLMIDTSQRAVSVSDQIWAFSYAGGGMIKRLRHVRDGDRNRLVIISDNPSVPDHMADPEDIHIIGKLVWVGRRV